MKEEGNFWGRFRKMERLRTLRNMKMNNKEKDRQPLQQTLDS